jgi:hypothetical protein
MNHVKRIVGMGLLALLLLAGCSRNPSGRPTPASATSLPSETLTAVVVSIETPAVVSPSATPTAVVTVTPTTQPFTEEDVASALDVVQDFLGQLSSGEYRVAYGRLLTTGGQEKLAELVLGRLALSNPRISYFELLGAEPSADRVAVDVVWRETIEGQGDLGTQLARVLVARQNGALLVDDIELGEFQPEATPVPPALPKAEALTSPVVSGQEMRFRATGFQSGEIVLAWLELPGGRLLTPSFQTSDDQGSLESVYSADVTSGQDAGQWIWWAQSLRDSTRNTGITFEVQTPPTPQPTATRAPSPTARPRPTQPGPTVAPVVVEPTVAPKPSAGYGAPTLLWPELETSRNYGSALIVEFVPVAEQLAGDEFYQLVLVARDSVGKIYNAGSVLSKGNACNGQRSGPCLSMIADERFMDPFHPDGNDGRGEWSIQVVKQVGPDTYEAVSPPSETRIVILKSRSE